VLITILLGCSEPETPSGKPTLETTVKNPMSPEKVAFFEGIEHTVRPLDHAVDDDFEHGRWSQLLEDADAADAKRKELGGVAFGYARQRAEALIALGRSDEALRLVNPEPNTHVDQLTESLALAMSGQMDAETALAHAEIARANFSSSSTPPAVAKPTSPAQIVACVRLERAIANRSSDLVAEREAREVLKAYPKQPIASYILVKSLGYQNRLERNGTLLGGGDGPAWSGRQRGAGGLPQPLP
jgi:hypothetical protein